MRYVAGIDIGTNTLLLLIAVKDQYGNMHVIRDEHRIARLGEGLNLTGTISEQAIQRACIILQEYAEILSQYEAITVKAIATSAMRDAHNASEVRMILESVLRYPIQIITGIEEAALTFLGSKEHFNKPVIIDIGGGSTEIIQLIDGNEHCMSIDIGAVRLTDTFIHQLPMQEEEVGTLKLHIASMINDIHIPQDATIIATAGTPTTLAAIDLQIDDLSSPLIHGHRLDSNTITSLSRQLCFSSLEEILRIPGVHPQRADILPVGTLILSMIVEKIHAQSCIVSAKGLRYGIVQSIM